MHGKCRKWIQRSIKYRWLGERGARSLFFHCCTHKCHLHLGTARFRKREQMELFPEELACPGSGGDLPLRAQCQSSWVPVGRREAEGRRGSGRQRLGRGPTPTGTLQRTGQRGGWGRGRGKKGGGSRGGGWRCPWWLVSMGVSWLVSSFSCSYSQSLIYTVL